MTDLNNFGKINTYIRLKTYGITHTFIKSAVNALYNEDENKALKDLEEHFTQFLDYFPIVMYGPFQSLPARVEFIEYSNDEDGHESFFVERQEAFESIIRVFLSTVKSIDDDEKLRHFIDDRITQHFRDRLEYLKGDKYIDNMCDDDWEDDWGR